LRRGAIHHTGSEIFFVQGRTGKRGGGGEKRNVNLGPNPTDPSFWELCKRREGEGRKNKIGGEIKRGVGVWTWPRENGSIRLVSRIRKGGIKEK